MKRSDYILRGHSTTTWTDFYTFWTPPPLRGQFVYPERGQKQIFFDPPPHLVHVVIECPLIRFPTDTTMNHSARTHYARLYVLKMDWYAPF